MTAVEKHAQCPVEDPLLPYLSPGRVRDAILKDGYCVIPGVFSRAECEVELARLWDFVEAQAPHVNRHDRESWYPRDCDANANGDVAAGGTKGEEEDTDPWPHSRWKSFQDMLQIPEAGWLFASLKERLASRIFEPLYGTRELHASKEGFTFLRPTAGGQHPGFPDAHGDDHHGDDHHGGAPESQDASERRQQQQPQQRERRITNKKNKKKRRAFVCGKEVSASHCGEHFDQGCGAVGLHCIQSSTSLLDQDLGRGSGCFSCWPGSHRDHRAGLIANTWRGLRSDWVPLTDGELAALRSASTAPSGVARAPVRVPVAAGTVILWRSDLVHAAAPPPTPQSPNQSLLSLPTTTPTTTPAPTTTTTTTTTTMPDTLQREHHRTDDGDLGMIEGGDSARGGPSVRMGGSLDFRAVVYACLLPAAMTPDLPEMGAKKLEAYLHRRTGDHFANREQWHGHKAGATGAAGDAAAAAKKGGHRCRRRNRRPDAHAAALDGGNGADSGQSDAGPRPPPPPPPPPPSFRYFRGGPPRVTWRQAELFGLVPYSSVYTHLRSQSSALSLPAVQMPAGGGGGGSNDGEEAAEEQGGEGSGNRTVVSGGEWEQIGGSSAAGLSSSEEIARRQAFCSARGVRLII